MFQEELIPTATVHGLLRKWGFTVVKIEVLLGKRFDRGYVSMTVVVDFF